MLDDDDLFTKFPHIIGITFKKKISIGPIKGRYDKILKPTKDASVPSLPSLLLLAKI